MNGYEAERGRRAAMGQSNWLWRSISVPALILGVSALPLAVGATNWQWVNPMPQGNPFNTAAFNGSPNARFAVGENGSLDVSAAGTNGAAIATAAQTTGGLNWQAQCSTAGMGGWIRINSWVSHC